MLSLKKQVIENYALHRSFASNVPAWSLDTELVNKFSTTYKQIVDLAHMLDSACHSLLREKCIDLTRVIFSSLGHQCGDRYEKIFLTELQIEVERILNEEMDWHCRTPETHFVKLRDDQTLADASNMFAMRHYFGRIPEAGVAELQEIASNDLHRLRENALAGMLRREDLSVNSGRTTHRIRDVLNREFSRLGVLDVLSAYTGRKTKVAGLALELSVPQATWWSNAIKGLDRPPKTLYAHVDESISFPKAIVYLTNVTEKNGPTGCYPGAYEAMEINPLQEVVGRVVANVGSRPESPLHDYYAKQYHQSMSSERFRQHFMRLPPCIRFNSHLGWDVAPEGELERSLANSERLLLGAAGTFIAFDGARLLHRGGMIHDGERVALQVIFSDMTTTQRVFRKVKRVFS
jgi:hypothetical protein